MKVKSFNHNSGTHLNIGGAKIYYEVIPNDDKPVLLFLHGGFGNIEDFNLIIRDLKQEFRVIGIDSRGQGKSTLGSSKLSYERIQKDAENVLNHLNIDTVSIIGFSDGGIVAYRLAALTSLNVEKLITIDSRWHLKNTEPTKKLFLSITAESWKGKFPEMYEAYKNLNPKPDFDFLTQSVINMWLDSSSSDYPNEAVENITCPLLIVRGDDDHLISKNIVFELSEIVKDARILNIPFAGHAAFNDQEEIFMLSLNEFLSQ